MTIKIRFVIQSFDGGKTSQGLTENWRCDRESREILEVCDAIDQHNQTEGFAKWYIAEKAAFFTWVNEFEDTGTGEIGKRIGVGRQQRVPWTPTKH